MSEKYIPVENDLRYPIGKFNAPPTITADDRLNWMAELESFPKLLRNSITGLSESQLDVPYRPSGWTVRQVVHHLADSHINSYVRFRLALTEDEPTIKPYNEAAWAELTDSRVARVELSLHLLESLHARWIILLRSLKSADMVRVFVHPERGPMTLDFALGLYAWHGNHHIAQIKSLRQREGW